MLRRPRSTMALAGKNRIGRLRGYGNGIVAPLAIEFIKAYMEVENG
jgi:DNA (cytosine-5)-methyltransferase 1